MEKAFANERENIFLTETFDIHRVPAHKMNEMPLELSGTIRIYTLLVGHALDLYNRTSADRTCIRQPEIRDTFRPFFRHRTPDFGNDLTGLIYYDRVADTDMKRIYEILIVQCGSRDCCTAEPDRIENRCRVDTACHSD